MSDRPPLSRREQQVMDIVHELQSATAKEIQARMTDPPSNGATRSVLRILVGKELLSVEQDGPRYVYSPTQPLSRARSSALGHLLETFFAGSVPSVIAALLERDDTQLSDEDYGRIRQMIDRAAEEGR